MRVLNKELKSTIKSNVGRYISIIVIIFLGVAFFVGMMSNSTVLKKTMSDYLVKYNNGDLKISSVLGLTDEDVEVIKQKVPEIESYEGKYFFEILSNIKSNDGKSTDYPIYVHSYRNDYKINKLKIEDGGRDIIAYNECLAGYDLQRLGFKLGDTIELSKLGLKYPKFKIVGFVRDPQYISFDKGASTLLGGMVNYTIYIDESNFAVKDGVYSTYDLKIKRKYPEFTKEYNDYVDEVKEKIEKVSKKVLEDRREKLIAEKTDELNKAEEEYNAKKAAVESELASVKKQISDAERKINNAKIALLPESKMNTYLKTVKERLDSTKKTLDASDQALKVGNEALTIAAAVANYTYNNTDFPDLVCEAAIKYCEYRDPDTNECLYEQNDYGGKPSDCHYDAVQKRTICTYGSAWVGNLTPEEENECDGRVAQLRQIEEVRRAVYGIQIMIRERKRQVVEMYNQFQEFDCNYVNDADLVRVCNQSRTYMQKKIKEEEERINELDREITALNKRLSKLQTYGSVVDEIRQVVTKLQSNHDKSVADYNEALDNYNSTNEAFKNKSADLRAQIAANQKKIAEAKAALEVREKEAADGLEAAYNKIIEGKQIIKNIEKHTWNIFARTDSYGYGSYYQDITMMDNLAKLFPMIFFIVASLVTATSITRLIQEERNKMGILKSLGLSKYRLVFKYLRYAFTAGFIGVVFGTILGIYLFPVLAAKGHGLRYYIPDLQYVVNVKAIIIAILLAFVSTVVIAFITAIRVANESPANLMRKRNVKKSIFRNTDRNKDIFKKMPVLKKLSYRNIFTAIIRSFMTIFGVAGCTALIIASFSVRNSVKSYITMQFNRIYNIDAEFYYKQDLSQYDIQQDYEELSKMDDVKNVSLGRKEVLHIKGNSVIKVFGVTPDSVDSFEKDMNFYRAGTGEKISLKDHTGVLINEKLAKLLNVKKGDKITFIDPANVEHTVVVNDIFENYMFNYIYMTKDTYKKLYDYDMQNNFMTIKYKDDVKTDLMTSELFNRKKYSNFTSVTYHKADNENVIKTIDNIIFVIIISAALLAFVVLYNIAKISISEKNIEIATLKVLGYNSKWINKFVNQEISILKYVGMVFGVVLGYLISDRIITDCEMDFMMFYHGISILSYIYGILLTIVFSWVIKYIVGKDVKKTSMTEALKATDE